MKNILAVPILLTIAATAIAGSGPTNQPPRKAGTTTISTNRSREVRPARSALTNRVNVVTNRPARSVVVTNTAPRILTNAAIEHPSLFNDNELNLDLAATYRSEKFGAGIGLTKFFNYSFGLGAETGINNIERINSIDFLNIVAVVRMPFEHFSPYLQAGLGREFHAPASYNGIAGAGLEYRFTPKVGVFGEARFLLRDARSDIGMGRVGLRFVF